MSTWLLITALVLYGTWFVWNERWRIAPIRRRGNHKVLWMGAMLPHDQKCVDDLLATICDAFLIPRRYRFRLRPSDDIHTFYRRNMRGQFADSLEYLILAQRFKERFGLDFKGLVGERSCTVGALVRCIARPRNEKIARPDAPPEAPSPY